MFIRRTLFSISFPGGKPGQQCAWRLRDDFPAVENGDMVVYIQTMQVCAVVTQSCHPFPGLDIISLMFSPMSRNGLDGDHVSRHTFHSIRILSVLKMSVSVFWADKRFAFCSTGSVILLSKSARILTPPLSTPSATVCFGVLHSSKDFCFISCTCFFFFMRRTSGFFFIQYPSICCFFVCFPCSFLSGVHAGAFRLNR